MKLTARDYWRPIVGLVALQPLVLLWCWLTSTDYLSNLGAFSLLSTVYLIPIYAWYERRYDMIEQMPVDKVGWPY